MAGETRAVWIPFMEFKDILTGKSREQFTSAIERRFALAAELGLNRLYIHVRPFGDALYRSRVFPSSSLITGTEGDRMEFDPLEIMTIAARKLGLCVEAWVNPFRVRSAYINTGDLCQRNPALAFLESRDVIEHRGGLAYNPASPRVWELVLAGVEELCAGYDLDGIHFDDYFYPTVDPFFDMDSYSAYKAPGGGLSQTEWRRRNVSLFLHRCWSQVHASGRDMLFGVSPKGFMDCNLNEEFFDVPHVLSKGGYVDYIVPQAYFAPRDEVYSFSTCVSLYDSLIKCGIPLIPGLPAYKLGKPDIHAGIGEEDWLQGEGVLAEMIECSRMLKNYGGYSLYDFASVFEPETQLSDRMAKERELIRALNAR